jgi:hypothetical protein
MPSSFAAHNNRHFAVTAAFCPMRMTVNQQLNAHKIASMIRDLGTTIPSPEKVFYKAKKPSSVGFSP